MPLFWDEEKQTLVPYPTAGATPVVGALPGTVPGAAASLTVDPARNVGGGYGMTTPQERAYHMQNMPDINSKKRALARQQALSEELRQSALPMRQRMDWASQAARGLSGIGSALIDQRAAKGQDDLSERIRRHWLNVPGMRDPDEERDWGV